MHEKKQAKFECVLNKEVTKVMWFRSTDIITSSSKYEIIDDGMKHILVVNQCEFEDEETYTIEVMSKRCSASLTVEGECSDVLVVFKFVYYLRLKKNSTLNYLTFITAVNISIYYPKSVLICAYIMHCISVFLIKYPL